MLSSFATVTAGAMPLNYSEAILFARAGQEMRREAWPDGDFIREVKTDPPPRVPEGYEVEEFEPTLDDRAAADWRLA